MHTLNQHHSETVKAACSRIAPLFPLQSFVAVNPFLGLSGMPFDEAAGLMERVSHSSILMDPAYFADKMRENNLDTAALGKLKIANSTKSQQILTVADWLDRNSGGHWAEFITDEISKWCSAYFDRGQCLWKMPWHSLDLYQAWRQFALLDANPEVLGLRGFRKMVQQLPETPEALIGHAISRLNAPANLLADLLHRELISVYGWSAYAAYEDRSHHTSTILPQLLAIRLAYDLTLLPSAPGWQCLSGGSFNRKALEAKLIAQSALETNFRAGLIQKLQPAAGNDTPSRKALQAIFCIDVRSELFRRALEAQSPAIETIGFAGFFGMPIEFSKEAHCPVLIDPKFKVGAAAPEKTVGDGLFSSWQNLLKSAVACFPSVEVSGVLFGMNILKRAVSAAKPQGPAPELHWFISLDDRIALAAGALKNMSLDVAQLAPVVLICGHGSQTENNPYAASLDCGACGGHKGDVNARFAAAILNDPEVRQGLNQQGVNIPGDTTFIAGLHNTTTDEVTLYELEQLPAGHRADLQQWLTNASRIARSERNPSLSEKDVLRRSSDWSEVRPEWGLAGNAAFIAAPRSRTRGANLQGRVFLHDYDWTADTGNSVLTLILTAPVVVASWINLQYYGSTVNNRLFGSGNKVIHNVVGTFGIWEGNAGDLRTGLPLQSLHDGTRWVHEPLRLQVFVDAPRHKIAQVIEEQQSIRDLVNNGWVHLIAMDGTDFYHWQAGGLWETIDAPATVPAEGELSNQLDACLC